MMHKSLIISKASDQRSNSKGKTILPTFSCKDQPHVFFEVQKFKNDAKSEKSLLIENTWAWVITDSKN